MKHKRTVPVPVAPPVDTVSNTSQESYGWYDRKTMDTLLTRDWFDDELECIQEVLDCADQDAWNWIHTNRTKYSKNIRMLIEPEDYRFPVEKLNIRVVELTDSMMNQIESERKKKVDAVFEKDWIEHSKSIPDRSFGDVDSKLDDAWDEFCRAKELLTKYLEKPSSKKYVAPGSRGTAAVDSKQAELEGNVRKMENEYDLAQKAVDEVDTLYWDLKKNDYRKTWMPTV
jgi:hypothetical protein